MYTVNRILTWKLCIKHQTQLYHTFSIIKCTSVNGLKYFFLHYTLYNINLKLHKLQCALSTFHFILQSTLCTVYPTIHIIKHTLKTVNNTLCTGNLTLHTVQCTFNLQIVHFALYSYVSLPIQHCLSAPKLPLHNIEHVLPFLRSCLRKRKSWTIQIRLIKILQTKLTFMGSFVSINQQL